MSPSLKFALFISVLCLVGGCTDTKNKQLLNDLNEENAQLRRRIEQLNRQIVEKEIYESSKRYIFVILKVEQTEGYPPEVVSYTNLSSIEVIDNLNEDLEYKLMDDFQNTYLKSIKAQLNKGIVRDRKIYSFATYAEASKAREQFPKQQ